MPDRSPLRVTTDGRFLERADGSPFFYLADTAWLLFNKLTVDEADRLFADRAAKGFTAVQACVFRDLFEPNTPNLAGTRPFVDDAALHAADINPAWLEHVVAVVRRAAVHGLTIGLLPTWGDKWNRHSNSAGPVVMDAAGGHRYCRAVSDALAGCPNVLWVLGGDSPIRSQADAAVVHAMAAGLRAGGSGQRLITFHPEGQASTALFHGADWLDINAIQSGHFRPNFPNDRHVERLFATPPTKPVMDLEANYEGISMFHTAWHGLQPKEDTVFSAYDVRKAYYRAVLAGAAGHGYGADPVRQILRNGDVSHGAEGTPQPTWEEALAFPGSSQLALLQRELNARTPHTRVPAQELVRPFRQLAAWADPLSVGLDAAVPANADPVSRISAARCSAGAWAMAYMPVRQTLCLDVSGMASKRLRLSVFDPETGELQDRRDLDRPAAYSVKKYLPMFEEDGVLMYVPKRDLDTFFVVDAL